MSGRGANQEGVMELAKSDLEVLKEIASQEIAPDRHGTDGGVEGEASQVRVRKFEPVNSRA